MEELRSTDILEREILEDARKKAERALKNAESEIASFEKEWLEKREKSMLDLEARYEKKTEDARRETESSLPLELKRRTVEYYDRVLREQLDRYFSSYDSVGIMTAIGQFLERSHHLFSGKSLDVRFGGLSREETERLLLQVFPGCTLARLESFPSIHGVILEVSGGSMRLTATLELLKQILLDERREELYSSLFEGK